MRRLTSAREKEERKMRIRRRREHVRLTPLINIEMKAFNFVTVAEAVT